jgi:translocator protein
MMIDSNIPSIWKLVIAVLFCEVVGISSGLLSMGEMNPWFSTLSKPSWNPPSYLFGPVWAVLYFLMGVALWLIWNSPATPQRTNATYSFLAQLFFNFCWSILFFKFHFMGLALVDIACMLITIVITILWFARISSIAAYLLIPYFAWVCFATLLNYKIWSMNT